MKSAGNDIVALALTDEDRTCRYRFYSRILTTSESSLYDKGLSFSSFVWLLWSVKEAVYKYASRSNPQLIFAPLKITVSRLKNCGDHFEGVVRFEGHLLYSRSFLVSGVMIHSIVSAEKDFGDVRWGVRATDDGIYANQSAQVRAFALEALNGDFPGASLRIVKSPEGPPAVWDNERPLDIPISLAHHDKYVAWSYCFTAKSSS